MDRKQLRRAGDGRLHSTAQGQESHTTLLTMHSSAGKRHTVGSKSLRPSVEIVLFPFFLIQHFFKTYYIISRIIFNSKHFNSNSKHFHCTSLLVFGSFFYPEIVVYFQIFNPRFSCGLNLFDLTICSRTYTREVYIQFVFK